MAFGVTKEIAVQPGCLVGFNAALPGDQGYELVREAQRRINGHRHRYRSRREFCFTLRKQGIEPFARRRRSGDALPQIAAPRLADHGHRVVEDDNGVAALAVPVAVPAADIPADGKGA